MWLILIFPTAGEGGPRWRPQGELQWVDVQIKLSVWSYGDIGSFVLQNINAVPLLPEHLLSHSPKAWGKEKGADKMRSDAFCIAVMVLSESLWKTVRWGSSVEFSTGSICLNILYGARPCCSAGSPGRYMGFLCKRLLFYGQQLNSARSLEACLYKPHIPHQDLSCEHAQCPQCQ